MVFLLKPPPKKFKVTRGHPKQGRIQDFWKGGGPSQARIQDFLKGGGGEDIHKHPPLDIARVTSSTFQGGGGDRSRSRTLCIGFQYRDKFKGGGVITPVTLPPRSATAS